MEDCESLPLKDDLAIYDIEIPDLPKDVIFPDEINRYLRDRIKYLTHENGMLEKNLRENTLKLQETETEMNKLDLRLKKYESNNNDNNTYVPSIELANNKIVELSKKLRDKTSEMESYKTKCTKLQKRVLELQSDDKFSSASPSTTTTITIDKNDTDQQQTIIKSLQDKLNAVSSKLFESKNVNVQLKNDLKSANKFLRQEIGDNLETLQCNSSNWRGRAQIICDLQEKNNELRDKLKTYHEKGQTSSKHLETSSSHTKNELKITCLMQENQNLTQELQELKRKFDTSRSRCKYLDTELIIMKTKLKATNEQNERDNDRLTSLTVQIGQLQNGQNESIKNMQKQHQKVDLTVKSLQTDLTKEKCLNENLQKELRNKEAVINELKHEISIGGSSSTFTSGRQKIIEKDMARLEAERVRLLELVSVSNKRLDDERNQHNNTQIQYLHERQKGAKLESRMARLQLDQQQYNNNNNNLNNSDRYSSYSINNTSTKSYNNFKKKEDNILDRLELAEENIKVLTTRLNIEKQERHSDFNEFKKILLEEEDDDEDDNREEHDEKDENVDKGKNQSK